MDFYLIGINSRQWPARLMAEQLGQAVNFSVYQSTSARNLWSQLGALKDDLLVYDKFVEITF